MEITNTNNSNDLTLFTKDKLCVTLQQPFQEKTLFVIENATLVVNSGQLTGVISSGKVIVYNNLKLNIIVELDHELVSAIDFSPNNKYLIIIQKPTIQNNLKIISLEDFSVKILFHSTTHPTHLWPQIKFSDKEEYMFKLLKGQLDVHRIGDDSSELYTSIGNIVHYDIAEIDDPKVSEIGLICGRVLTDEKTKKKKSLVSFYKLSDLSKPIKEMTVSACDRMKLKVSPDKKGVLINSISDDTSSSSYYGESSLYFMDLLYGKFQKLNLAEGPIHDFSWTPNG